MKFLILISLIVFAGCASEQTSLEPMGLTSSAQTAKRTDLQTTLAAKAIADANKAWGQQKPRFIGEDRLPTLAKSVNAFPVSNSVEQRADEVNLLSLQEMRTKEDCARASTEVKTNLGNFYGPPYGPLTKDEVAKLTPLFEQVRTDTSWFVYRIKTERGRKRPFAYIKGLEPCVEKEMSPAFPSGHATASRVYALILSDLFPSRTKAILKRSDEIANDRVLAGMHHRSDILAGQALGEQIYKELVRSPDFRRTVAGLETKP